MGAVADSSGALALTARRSHLRDGGDAFPCFCTSLEGDGELTAHLVALGTSAPRVAVMMREVLAAEAPFVATVADAQGAWQVVRPASGASLAPPSPAAGPAAAPAALPIWMRLTRRGSSFTSSVSVDGRSWRELGRATVPMGTKVLAGLAVLNDSDGEARAGLDSVSLRRPFRGQALAVPGRIEAEEFDRGGEGVAYHDTTPGDAGRLGWREGDVDIKAVEGGGYRITETASTEWLEYTVSVARTEDYRIDVQVASSGCGGTFHLELDGRDVSGALSFPNTDSFSRDWAIVGPERIKLPRGDSRLRLVIDSVGPSGRTAAGSIDWISIVPYAPRTSANVGSAGNLPAAAAAGHPRLFLAPERLQALKAAIKVRGSHHAIVFDEIRRRVEAEDWRAYDETPGPEGLNHGRMGLAQEAALAYILTGNERYSQVAYRSLEAVYSEPDPHGAFLEPDDYASGVLHRSRLGLGFALAYDWSSAGWSAEQRAFVRGKIVGALDRWPCVGNPALESPYESHWVAAFRGAELVMMLASGEEQARPERYAKLKQVLVQHMHNAYGPSGLFHRGLGFGVEAAQFLMPAVYASRSVGDRDLDPEFSAHSWGRLLMATTPLGDAPLLLPAGFIPTLPASARVSWASLVLGSVEPKELPYYRWFYDRMVAVKPPGKRFEGPAAVWALLHYPEGTPPRDPNQGLGTRLEDPVVGAHFFRSRWQDEGDALVSVLADSKATPNFARWNVADAFGLNLIAHGQWLIQNAATEPTPQSFSSLLVDGAASDDNTRTGAVELFEPRGRGGSLVLDGGTKYAKLGLEKAKRQVSVDFPSRDAACVLATLDRVRAPASHVYTWQINLPDRSVVDAQVSMDEGVRTFTLLLRSGVFLKGWLLHPSEATLVPDDPLQISISGRDADIWVVLAAGTGKPPSARLVGPGRGLKSQLELAGLRLRYDAGSDRLSVDGPERNRASLP